MSSSNSTVRIAVGVVVGAAAIVGAIAVLKTRGGAKVDDADDAFSATKPSAPKKIEKKDRPQAAAPVREVKPTAVDQPASRVEVAPALGAPQPIDDADALLDAALNEVAPMAAVISAPASTAVATSASAAGDNRTSVGHLGLSLQVPSGWEVREELSPVPNVAMVTVWNPAFASMPDAEVPGAVPVIILSVEDIHGENLNITEFKERSRELSMQQMLMMTGGAIQPVVRKDVSVQEGPFRHMLEYSQSMPPFFDISVINLLEVRNGVAYVFQIMASPRVMNQYKSTFMQIARDTIVTPMESCALGYLRVSTGKVSIDIDTVWGYKYPSADAAGQDNTPLATFELNSTMKKERITLYEAGKVPKTEHKPRGEKEVDGVKITSGFNGSQERKVFTYNDYALVVEPLQKAISFLPEASVVLALKSVRACSDEPRPRDGATFFSPEYGYKFDVVGGSRVVSTKLGRGTVVYAPLGIPQDMAKEMPPEDQGPTVTVRIGSPEEDPDCMATLDEWKSRIEGESASSDITGIKIIDAKGLKCLSFKSKEMQETGPGQKTEVIGEVYIFVRDGITTLIRWETAKSQWKKFERSLAAFLDTFQFLE